MERFAEGRWKTARTRYIRVTGEKIATKKSINRLDQKQNLSLRQAGVLCCPCLWHYPRLAHGSSQGSTEALQVPGAQLHQPPVPAEPPGCSGAALAEARHHPVQHGQDHKEWRMISCSTNPALQSQLWLRDPFLKLWLGGEGQDHERQGGMSTAGLVARPEQVQGAMAAPHQQHKDQGRGPSCFHAPLTSEGDLSVKLRGSDQMSFRPECYLSKTKMKPQNIHTAIKKAQSQTNI